MAWITVDPETKQLILRYDAPPAPRPPTIEEMNGAWRAALIERYETLDGLLQRWPDTDVE